MQKVSMLALGLGLLGAVGCTGGDDDDSSSSSSSTGGASSSSSGGGATKVGFLYVGPLTDYGWTKSHEDGRNYLETYGDNVQTFYKENALPANADALIDDLVAQGCNIIFTTSFDFLAAAQSAPARHPGLWTLNCSGFKTGDHFGSYQARVEEMEYLTGMVAGRMTTSNKIGIVAALRIYEQMVHINAFTLGVRAVNPNAQVLVRWMGWWYDVAREGPGTTDLIAEGCDVIKGLTDTNIPLSTAATAGVWTMGHDSKDGCSVSPEKCVVTSFYNWGPFYNKLVTDIRTGAYPTTGRSDYLGSADLDVVGLSDFATAVPQDVRTLVTTKKADIQAGTFNVFQGPFSYDDGGVWKSSGQTLTDAELLCTNRYVAGVSDFHGPTCTGATECGDNLDCVNGKCQAPDYSGCGASGTTDGGVPDGG